MRRSASMKRIAVIAASALAVCAFAFYLFGSAGDFATPPGGSGVALPASESLADEDGGPVSLAASYDDASLAKFESVMHVENADGDSIPLGDVPASDYSGFLFKVKTPVEGAGDVATLLAEAADMGLVRNIAGDLYEATSLDTLAGLLDAAQVSFIEPNFNLHLIGEVDDDASVEEAALRAMGGTPQNATPDWPPTDQYYLAGKLWNLDMLNVQGAWAQGLDGDPYVYNETPVRDTPVRVAIIDTGLYGTGVTEQQHEDFDYDKIEVGYDWINLNNAGAPDAKGHGTFVAGLIGARVNNEGIGVAGIMPGAILMPEKVFDTGSATTANVISAIYHASGYYNGQAGYAAVVPADVINMSLGGEYNESSLEEACDYAVDQGILVVASAGNDGVSTPNYPAAYDSVVGVASVNSSEQRSTWSQYGTSVYVTAPGESVSSTYNEGADSYATASGTSFSGPEVAALAAMCKSVYPDIDQDTFKLFLRETSRQLDGNEEGKWNQYYGYGMVDFNEMASTVLASQTLPWYNLTFDVVDSSGVSVPGATIAVSAAEDISWLDDDTATPAITAGSWAKGATIEPIAAGTWKVHRGNYAYKVSAPGYYTVTGTLKTFAENQRTDVKMQAARQATVNVVDSAGSPMNGASLTVSSAQREEEPTGHAGSAYTYDLAPGPYSFAATAADEAHDGEAYEAALGSFVMGHEDASFNAVLYKPDELSTVSFRVTSQADGSVLTRNVGITVADASGVMVAQGDDGAFRLAKGKAYRATVTKVGFDTTTADFTVTGTEEQTVDVAMRPAQNRIVFRAVDESGTRVQTATVKVANAEGAQIDPRESESTGGDSVFYLPLGSYTYEVTAPGYEGVQGTLDVSTSGITQTVTLKAVPQTVSFNVTDADSGAGITGASIKVSTTKDHRTIAGSGTWQLAPGDYRYTVYKQGYEAAQGTFTVAGGALVVDVKLQPKAQGETKFAGGSGTEDDPYLIATEGQLRYLAQSTEIVRMGDSSADTNKHAQVGGWYKLIDDIELTSEWYPIGNEESSSNYVRFTGHFDGNGHTVSNVYINQPGLSYQGFFGSVAGATPGSGDAQGATISNLVVTGPGIVGDSYVGGLVGRVHYTYSSEYPAWNTLSTAISQCGSELDVSGKYAVGGIVGSAQGTDQDSAGKDYSAGTAGGISVVSCYNDGNVTAAVGGEFTANSSAAGGIVGSAQQVLVQDCYNKGAVQAGYNAGGLAGNARRCTLYTSYNSGKVVQYVKTSGRENTAGGVAGNAYYTVASDCYFLERDDSTNKVWCGSPDTASTHVNCVGKPYDDMYRAEAFVGLVNHNSATSTTGGAFALGRDFPLLSWQVAPGALLAPAPHVIVQPQGIEARNAYKQGGSAAPLTAQVAAVSAGTVTWAWYACSEASGAGATAIAGATGTGLEASFTPPTDAIGTAYYYCLFTNSVSDEGAHDEAAARTDAVAIYVRSAADAQAPAITKLNPSQTAPVNADVVVKAGTEAHLSVEAEVGDGGELSYQWYSALVEGGEPTPIEDATSSAFDAPTSDEGAFYYYVAITNALSPGNEAVTFSSRITVTVIPYTIESYDDLAAFRSQVNGGTTFLGVTVTLIDDIEIPDGIDWTPIGTVDAPFRGSFMGGEGIASSDPGKVVTHKVTNLRIDGDAHGNQYLGLFGYTQDALIFDVQVQGEITGAANVNAGLLVGYASTYSTSGGYAYIENCTTLPGSSVEGKYRIGGLAGAGGSNFNNCANHADVRARAFAHEAAPATAGWWAVGGVTGYAGGSGELMGCYNTGTVVVDAVTGDDCCAEYVGGVVGYTGYISGVYSGFGAGTVGVGSATQSPLTTRGKVRYAGAVAGYVTYGNCANIHYLEGSYDKGAGYDDGSELADCHSYAYFKSDYFLTELATGYSRYAPSHFASSARGVPHYAWEDENIDARDDGKKHTSEPHMVAVQSEDIPKITSTWRGTYYEGGVANPIYLLAESTDGGSLEFYWQERDPSSPGAGSWGFDDGWGDYRAAVVSERVSGGRTYQAGSFTVPVDAVGHMQYRLVVRSVLEGAEPEADGHGKESATNPITVTVLDAEQGLFLLDPNGENGTDNPWVIDSPTRMKLFADLVNGAATLPGLDDAAFTGQYVKLYADIDLSGYDNWTPIGAYGGGKQAFKGVFDGDGHKVVGLSIDRQGTAVVDNAPWYPEDYTGVGLFGAVSMATVRNLEVQGNVYLDNLRTSSSASQAWMTGGIVGRAFGSYIENCVNRVNVAGWQGVGGIVGTAEATVVKDCENLGTVKLNESSAKASYGGFQVGGIVGYLDGSAAAEAGAGVYNCFNAGSVVGHLWDGSYNSGAVVGEVSDAVVQGSYYLAGTITCDNAPNAGMTGVGTRSTRPQDDAAGVCLPVENADNPEAAWSLNMSPAKVTQADELSHSGRWGDYARADLGDASARVHLVQGDAAKAVYRVDTACESAVISAEPEYAVPGETVQVSWRNKAGFDVSSVSWASASTGDGADLGTGNAGSGSVVMPAGDVAFAVEASQNMEQLYQVTVDALYDGRAAPSSVGSVAATAASAVSGTKVDLALAAMDGYQVKSVSAESVYGDALAVARIDGLHYSFVLGAADVRVKVVFEDRGTPVVQGERASSLAVNRAGIHNATESARVYHDPNLLFDMVVFSGSYFGAENPMMTSELEALRGVGLFEQAYSIDGEDKLFTGVDLALLIHAIGGSEPPAADAPVRIETGSGDVYECAYRDLEALTYNRYDATGQPIERGLPVLLFFGVDDVPNTQGGAGVVFGETAPFKKAATNGLSAQSDLDADGGAVVLHDVTRVSVAAAGQPDINYSQHVYGLDGYPFDDLTWVDGGELNGDYGQSTLHVRTYRTTDAGRELVSERAIPVTRIEQMANEDVAGAQRGYYSVMLYEERDEASDGVYNDYYEGYDLYKILKWAGVPYEPDARVQFYQSGMNGLENSWETVDVSLGYLAGNGPDGEGDYSNNAMTFRADKEGAPARGSGTLTGVRPMVAYGKNGVPLVWGSGQQMYGYYNYRGPMMAFLPQNEVEGGPHVGTQSAMSCYLGLIDVYLPQGAEVPDDPADSDAVDVAELTSAITAARAALQEASASADGADVPADGKWVTDAERQKLVDAIAQAQRVMDGASSTQDQIDGAVDELNRAVGAFKAAMRPGSGKSSPSDGGSDSDSKSASSGGSGTSGGSNASGGSGAGKTGDNPGGDGTGGGSTADADGEPRVMYRLYNPYSGEHHYTADAAERDGLVKEGWIDEGEGWTAPAESSTPVWRLYNSHEPLGDHHYTVDRAEYDNLVAVGWTGEGVGWYSDDAKGRALYRVYNPNAYALGMTGAHHYTIDKSEADGLADIGWAAEGVAWYGVREVLDAQSVPLGVGEILAAQPVPLAANPEPIVVQSGFAFDEGSSDFNLDDAQYVRDERPALPLGAPVKGGGGDAAYAWYRATSPVQSLSDELVGESSTCTPSTASVGTFYYYCVATCGAGGQQQELVTESVKVEVLASASQIASTFDEADSPVRISTKADLEAFREAVNASGQYGVYSPIDAVLLHDIDLQNELWTPIGSIAGIANGKANASGLHVYCGTFDGMGHAVSNLNAKSSIGGVGLFGYVDGLAMGGTVYGGVVKNLVVKGTVSSEGPCTGGVVAIAGENASFSNVGSEVNVSSTYNNSSYGFTGGVVGKAEHKNVRFEGCYNKGAIAGYNHVAGICAFGGTAANCCNLGTVTARRESSETYAGGILGDGNGGASGCYGYGAVSTPRGSNYGAILASGSVMDSCYYHAVNTDRPCGGYLGYSGAGAFTAAGELLASLPDGLWQDGTEINSGFAGMPALAWEFAVREYHDVFTGAVEPAGSGSFTLDKTRAAAGDAVAVTAQPGEAKVVSAISVTKGSDGTVSVSPTATGGSFTMPDDDVTVAVTFADAPATLYSVTVVAPSNGSLSVDPTAGVQNRTITVTATPASECELKSITVTDAGGHEIDVELTAAGGTFRMPASNVAVSAVFGRYSYHSVRVAVSPGQGVMLPAGLSVVLVDAITGAHVPCDSSSPGASSNIFIFDHAIEGHSYKPMAATPGYELSDATVFVAGQGSSAMTSLSLHLAYASEERAVTFDPGEGAFPPDAGLALTDGKLVKNVANGSTVVGPTVDPQREGYVFAGWYDGETQFSASEPIVADAVYAAMWVEATQVAGTFLTDLSGSDRDGSYAMPYRITTERDLYDFARVVNGCEPVDGAWADYNGGQARSLVGTYVSLENDIELTAAATPVGLGSGTRLDGDYASPFSGTFLGNNHVISNFSVTVDSNPEWAGTTAYGTLNTKHVAGAYSALFGSVAAATIQDVRVQVADGGLALNGPVAGLVAQVGAGFTRIGHCSVDGAVQATGGASGAVVAGGLVGVYAPDSISSTLSIDHCYQDGAVVSANVAGGLVGSIGANGLSASSSYHTGDVFGAAGQTGGFVGGASASPVKSAFIDCLTDLPGEVAGEGAARGCEASGTLTGRDLATWTDPDVIGLLGAGYFDFGNLKANGAPPLGSSAWEQGHSITFTVPEDDATGSAPRVSKQSAGAKVVIPVCTLERVGFVLAGWLRVDADGDDTVYAPGSTFTMPDADVEFAAQWKSKEPSDDESNPADVHDPDDGGGSNGGEDGEKGNPQSGDGDEGKGKDARDGDGGKGESGSQEETSDSKQEPGDKAIDSDAPKPPANDASDGVDAVGSGDSAGKGGNDAGRASGGATSPSASTAAPLRMHRLYNPYTGEHFYTSDEAEREHVVAAGWTDEGIGWSAPESGDPVYRLYNQYGGEHHYTTSADERDALVEAGWTDEGTGWYSDPGKAVPLYREYNPNMFSCNHNYTTDKAEHDGLVLIGWADEGIAWYGVKDPSLAAASTSL